MRVLLLIILALIVFSCNDYDYDLSALKKEQINFNELAPDIKEFFYDPSDYPWYNEEGFRIGIKKLIPLDNPNRYKLETNKSIVKSWIAYYKLYDLNTNIIYRIDQGTPSPFVVLDNKLYLQDTYNVFISVKDFSTLKIYLLYTKR